MSSYSNIRPKDVVDFSIFRGVPVLDIPLTEMDTADIINCLNNLDFDYNIFDALVYGCYEDEEDNTIWYDEYDICMNYPVFKDKVNEIKKKYLDFLNSVIMSEEDLYNAFKVISANEVCSYSLVFYQKDEHEIVSANNFGIIVRFFPNYRVHTNDYSKISKDMRKLVNAIK